jgi:hypothetical protein
MRRKSSTTNKVSIEVPITPIDKAPYWDFFFRDQRSPVLRSMLVVALMAGKAWEVDRLPTDAMLDAVLLSCACRANHTAEVVDDFEALLRRTSEVWKSPMWTRKTFDQVHSCTASFIVLQGTSGFGNFEERYIPDLAGWYLARDAPKYFTKELV